MSSRSEAARRGGVIAGRGISPRSACVGGVTGGTGWPLTPLWYHSEVEETGGGSAPLLPISRSQAAESLIVWIVGDSGTEPADVVRAAGRPPANVTPSSSLSESFDSYMLLEAVAVRRTPPRSSATLPGVGVLLGLTFHSRFRPVITAVAIGGRASGVGEFLVLVAR